MAAKFLRLELALSSEEAPEVSAFGDCESVRNGLILWKNNVLQAQKVLI